MSMPFYVSPEQLMKDRADFARKGIARGRSVVVIAYDEGILFATENPSRALHKISEIYDRIAFAAVGKYNEFENLRVAGVRYADLRGFSYDRTDVNARGLANAYAQTLGTVFTTESKPLEVELVVAEVGPTPAQDQIYRLSYDGSVADEQSFVVMGGHAEDLGRSLEEHWRPEMTLGEALDLAVRTLSAGTTSAGAGAHAAGGTNTAAGTNAAAGANAGGAPNAGAGGPGASSGGAAEPASSEHESAAGPDDEERRIPASQLEVAVLDRTRPRRAFRRLPAALLDALLSAK